MSGDEAPTARRWWTILRRLPFTLALLVAILLVAVLTGSLVTPASAQPWFPFVATGLPALGAGHWWTPLSSPFVLDSPLRYAVGLPLALLAIGWGEWRIGTRRAALVFGAGHLFGVLGAAGLLAALRPIGWEWVAHLASRTDAGPAVGALALLVFAIATLHAPWRLRARLAVGTTVALLFLYLGRLADVEHVLVVTAALLLTGFLPAYRHRAGRPSEREWRLIGFVGLLVLGAVELIDLLVPYDGPLGKHTPGAFSFLDVATDVIVIALFSDGIRRGYRFAWIIVQAWGWLNVLFGLFVIAIVPVVVALGATDVQADLGQVFVPTLLWLAVLVFLILGRGSFRVPMRRSRRVLRGTSLDRAETVRRLQAVGGGTISWMTTWPANRRLAAEDGFVAYQAHNGVAIMLGDPVVPQARMGQAIERFVSETQQVGLIPCVFSAGAAAAAARPEGWRALVVAQDTLVDLPDLAFTGKKWNSVRTSLNRAEREGIRFRLVRLSEEPWRVLAQVRAISEQWAGDKGLPEMRFTLGTVDDALAPEVLTGIAEDEDGNLHGVTSWLPVYAGEGRIRGWTLDLMRRRDDGFPMVMEFLIAASARRFAEDGYEFVSLSGAPLVRPESGQDGPVEQVLDRVAEAIEPLYGFATLHRFKQKFSPRSEPLSLLYRDEGDLPRIGLAMTGAYLPDATLRDLLRSASAVQERRR